MVHGATDGSSQLGHERPIEKREQPHSGGMERKEVELGWKIKGERPRHNVRIRQERRARGGEFGDGGHNWRGH
jgi:hypothetical protein